MSTHCSIMEREYQAHRREQLPEQLPEQRRGAIVGIARRARNIYIRAALSGEIMQQVPRWVETLSDIRKLANESMYCPVPHFCLDLIGQGGFVMENDSDLSEAGDFIDILVVPRKMVCVECQDTLICCCNSLPCTCTEIVNKLCEWCEWDDYQFEHEARSPPRE